MYSFPNFEPVHCFMSSSNCCVLAHIQVSQKAGKVVWYSHILKNFPQLVVIHTVKAYSVVNEAEVDVFLESPCFLYDRMAHPLCISVLTGGDIGVLCISLKMRKESSALFRSVCFSLNSSWCTFYLLTWMWRYLFTSWVKPQVWAHCMGNKKLNRYLWNRNLEPNPEVAKCGLLQTARSKSRHNIEAS